jgi:hypothetical protein
MLGDVIGVEPGLVGRGDVGQALIELLGERIVGAIDMVEDGEFHGFTFGERES